MLRKSEALLVFTAEGSINYESEKNTHDVLIHNHGYIDKSFYHPSVKPINVGTGSLYPTTIEKGPFNIAERYVALIFLRTS